MGVSGFSADLTQIRTLRGPRIHPQVAPTDGYAQDMWWYGHTVVLRSACVRVAHSIPSTHYLYSSGASVTV